jgi:hypothetical protein
MKMRIGIVRGTTFIMGWGGGQKLTALVIPRLHPLVPLEQGRALGSEEGQVMGSRLSEYVTEERS